MPRYIEVNSNSGLISIGNTSARLADPRIKYIEILKALVEFRKSYANWGIEEQREFGNYLTSNDVFELREDTVVGIEKDARVKTGFLSQLGFVNELRTITEAGQELISNSQHPAKSELDISAESYSYLKQFLKYQQEGFSLYPLLSLIYSCLEFDNDLPLEFLTFLWSSSQTKEELVRNISNYKSNSNYRLTLYQSIKDSKNTQTAKNNINLFFCDSSIKDKTELKKLLFSILPHGKGNTFKEKTILLFYDLLEYWTQKDSLSLQKKKKFIQNKVKSRHRDMSSKSSKIYMEAIFGESFSSEIDTLVVQFEQSELMSSENENDFILNFHFLYMYIKKVSVCLEYQDLNIRHLRLLDIFVFEFGRVKLDLLFYYIFQPNKVSLLDIPLLNNYSYRTNLESSQENIGDIYSFLKIDISDLINRISKDYPEIESLGLLNFAFKKKEERLMKLVNEVFTKENIITIFENIYPRNDSHVRKLLKDWYSEYDATIPALFEYLLGIAFYWISEKEVNISSILNSNLDSNLLPNSHAPGGKADIIIHFKKKDYLIEATLSENDGQRKMEAEPVPRHLAKHIIENNKNSIAIFVAGQLDPNNLVVLRNYKFSKWYSSDGINSVDSMDILPLTIKNMIYLLQNGYKFDEIQSIFEDLVNSDLTDGYEWYKQKVNTTFNHGN
jgi:hypothetical protein